MEIKSIKNIRGLELLENINLDKYTTIKLGNTGSIAICKSITALKELIKNLKEQKIIYHLVGWGANQVILNAQETLFIKLDFDFDKSLLKDVQTTYEFPASVSLNLLTSHAMKFGLKGWEVFTGIPGSIGGAIFMNAGTALGEIGDLVESVDILKPTGEVYTYICKPDSFKYRGNNFMQEDEIILSAKMKHLGIEESIKTKIKEYLNYRKTTQPLATKNCGSVFKNFDSKYKAGQTIDTIGLKNFGYDNLKVSSLHANFVENSGDARAEQFKNLVDCLKIDIERYSGRKFVLEVKVY